MIGIRIRRLLAPLARATAPSYTCCLHCGMPWAYVKPHDIPYTQTSHTRRYIFVTCTRCWPHITGEELRTYASRVVNGSGIGWQWNQQWNFDSAIAVVTAVAQISTPADEVSRSQ